MKKLLIHSNNCFLAEENVFQPEEQAVIDFSAEEDVDAYFSTHINGRFLGEKINSSNIVFIKVSLSDNYLDYLGIRLAYHIRLSPNLGLKRNIPIDLGI